MSEEKYKVLFLEDEPTILEVLTEYMLISGYEVVTADRGDTAIELLKKQQFHIAVLDICVPGVDGFIEIYTGKPEGDGGDYSDGTFVFTDLFQRNRGTH